MEYCQEHPEEMSKIASVQKKVGMRAVRAYITFHRGGPADWCTVFDMHPQPWKITYQGTCVFVRVSEENLGGGGSPI
jgi:hypothetical protein